MLLPPIFQFQTSIETVRAHHWRYFSDAYTGCAFNCQYCLYKGPGDYGAHVKPRHLTEASIDRGILDLGTTTDPYQPIEERTRYTRSLLEFALKQEIPVFLLTRGTLVTRDIDVLQKLAERELIEVCFSVITLSDVASQALEKRAPLPQDRLDTAATLRAAGVPVSFHVAPLIPGLSSDGELRQMGRTLGETCGTHVFSAMLGAQKGFWSAFYPIMESLGDHIDLPRFEAAYPRDTEFDRDAAVTTTIEHARPVLDPLRDGVMESGAIFVSENYPFLTTGQLAGGIYNSALPTAYDMAKYIADSATPVSWPSFLDWYQRFDPSPDLIEVVRSGWQSGELFDGTGVARDADDAYSLTDTTSAPAERTLVARRLM